MKFVKLLTAAYVNGALRHPHEGVLHVEDKEAARLVTDKVAEDVTSDFSSAENQAAPADSISADASGSAVSGSSGEPHQAEVAPQAAKPSTPVPGRKASAHKE